MVAHSSSCAGRLAGKSSQRQEAPIMNKRLQQVASKLRRQSGVSRVEVNEFSSGAASLTVWFGDRCFGLDSNPNQGSIVYDVAEQIFDAGPAKHFDRLDDDI